MKSKTLSISFTLKSESEIYSEFKRHLALLNQKMKTTPWDGQLFQDLATAFTEGAANAIRHGQELKKSGLVQCRLSFRQGKIQIFIDDHGKGFNLNRIRPPQFKKMKESGRGIFMMRQLMDQIAYQKGKTKNTLALTRFLSDSSSEELELVYEISQAVLESRDPKTITHIILDKAVKVFGVDKASILIQDPKTKRLKVAASLGLGASLVQKTELKPGEGISGYVFKHAKPCLIEDMERNQAGWKKKGRYKSKSFISAPMVSFPLQGGTKVIGVINMTDRTTGKPFVRKDLRLLTTIANQAAAYLHMVELMGLARDAEGIKKELEIARQIQRSYLPQNPPQYPGWKLAGWCETAQSVGGDYFDFIGQDAEHFFAVIADVSGHNVAAAITMANFRSQLKALLLAQSDPGAILTELNALLFSDLETNAQFISMILARLNKTTGHLEWASAGHLAPFLCSSKTILALDGTLSDNGAVLGALPGESYVTQHMSLDLGQTLVLFTDGANESMGPLGTRLGVPKFKEFLNKAMGTSSPLEELKREMAHFRGKTPIIDDVTVMLVKRES